jgi:shikimate dehydrogenase
MKFAVLGSPIEHSLSPILHNYIYEKFKIKASYERYKVEFGTLSKFLEEHSHSEWQGFSLTMPLKEEALQACYFLDEDAVAASAVNTLYLTSQGWKGFNTDVFGFRFLLDRHSADSLVSIQGSTVGVLGAGGTARSALVALRNSGARIKIYRRNPQRDRLLRQANSEIEILDWDRATEVFASEFVINTAPIEAMTTLSPPEPFDGFLIDSLYSPWPTPLISKIAGGACFSGKDLLVAQALRQIEIFLGKSFDHQEMFSQLRELI